MKVWNFLFLFILITLNAGCFLKASITPIGSKSTSAGSSNDTENGNQLINENAVLNKNFGLAPSSDDGGDLDFQGTKLVQIWKTETGSKLVRFNGNGTPDLTFGVNGEVDLPTQFFYTHLKIDSGNLIVVGGVLRNAIFPNGIIKVQRYLPDGAVDVSFGLMGTLELDIGITNIDGSEIVMELQADNKILIVARVSSDLKILRIQTNGSLDASFGTAGYVTIDVTLSSWDSPEAIHIQNDGKILIASAYGAAFTGYALTRLLATGALDLTFATGGSLILNPSPDAGYIDSPSDIISDNSSIYLSGNSDEATTLYKIDKTTGNLDLSFGTSGLLRVDIIPSYQENVIALKFLSDGKILALGNCLNYPIFGFYIAKFLPDGSLDSSFGSGGVVMKNDLGASPYMTTIQVKEDDSFLISGTIAYSLSVVAFNSSGALSSSFGVSGVLMKNQGTSSGEWANFTAKDSSGNIFLTGVSNVNGTDTIFVAKYKSNFDLDLSFGNSGYSLFTVNGLPAGVNSIKTLPDGKILIGGNINGNKFYFSRLLSNGQLDSSFGLSGVLILDFDLVSSNGESLIGFDVLSDGKIMMVGQLNGGYFFSRINPSGAVDNTFGTSGVKLFSLGSSLSESCWAIQKTVNDNFIVGGSRDGILHIFKIDAQGDKDLAFGGAGALEVDLVPGQWVQGHELSVLTNGDIFLGVSILGLPKVVKVTPSGALDSTFGLSGILSIDVVSPWYSNVKKIHFLNDGKIEIMGTWGQMVTVPKIFVQKLLANGTKDTSFGQDGLASMTLDFRGNAVEFGHGENGSIFLMGDLENSNTQKSDISIFKFIGD